MNDAVVQASFFYDKCILWIVRNLSLGSYHYSPVVLRANEYKPLLTYDNKSFHDPNIISCSLESNYKNCHFKEVRV